MGWTSKFRIWPQEAPPLSNLTRRTFGPNRFTGLVFGGNFGKYTGTKAIESINFLNVVLDQKSSISNKKQQGFVTPLSIETKVSSRKREIDKNVEMLASLTILVCKTLSFLDTPIDTNLDRLQEIDGKRECRDAQ
ncbi:hypothetical protein HNY73_006425 [Argiope bruennichi]|uniref:Uncharacterized protein n=1 Tax=Argiope bruennichi TaxID=94029 RepID=A0A8T0FS99_ARGBR|nr:hypothetical protein HNY73_006425 [Argiope bruennichi]